MTDWRTKTVEECLLKVQLGSNVKLQTQEYRQSGRFPIVDQGQSFIAGWTDDERGVVAEGLPYVVFGDHTRAFKYVDFPFVRGADGTQILKPTADIDPLFFFYALRALDLPSRGYNRHFSVLKEKEIRIANDDEQTAIAHVLKLAETAVDVQARQNKTWKDLKRAAMRALFSKGLRGEAQKNTEIGPAPESWEVVPLGKHYSAVSGGTPSRANAEFWNGGTIPWVKTTEVDYGVITSTEEHITEAGLQGSAAKWLQAGTLLMAMYGQGVTRGKVAILGINATCNQACAALRPLDESVDSMFLFHFLSWRYDEIRQLAHGGQQQNLNLDIVRDLPIACPPTLDEQREIVAVLDAIDCKIDLHKRRRAALDELFKLLLHKLMTGKIRIADLDLSALETAQPEGAAA